MSPPIPASPPDSASRDPQAAVRAVTRLSVTAAVVLIVLKTFALGASGSTALLASLADSSLDLIASLATFFAVRWAAAPADAGHRFGHGKGEAMAALVQAGLVFASSLFIAWEAMQRIFDPRPVENGGWAVGVMILSILITLFLVWRQTLAVRASGSLAVAGDRAHYSADLAANLVVLIGVASGAWLGAAGLDAAAGLVVAVWLFWGASGVLRAAADQLLDHAASASDEAAVVAAVTQDARIGGVHRLRTRRSGAAFQVLMHVDLDPTLSLKAAHAIVAGAEDRVRALFPDADVLIHADPHVEGPPPSSVPLAPAAQ